MKKISLITIIIISAAALTSCNKVRRNPGRAYMPDMTYSRAYETYASVDALKNKGVNYNAMPVAGTIARGDSLAVYPYKNDSSGYANSKNVTNPLPALDAKQYMEASRLYLIYCGICHGEKLDGNGPLWNNGDGAFPAAPKNLLSDPLLTSMAPGTMFHSITYGKNLMGGHASLLSTEQRWMVVHYIKDKQAAAGNKTNPGPVKDSATTGK
ncbi:MAG TPA: c-type cytochrome [Chitinophagaceae bacterium]|nr:c-type cytochrome [Chitinophagaceae bacterium]